MQRPRVLALGVVLLVLASAILVSLLATSVRATSYPTPAAHVDGNVTAENFGRSVALVDLNRDGIADLVVGAPHNSANGMTDAGSVTIYLSSPGVPMRKIIVINGSHAGDLFGWSVANVGDVNGAPNGYPDLAVGAPQASPAAGGTGNITIFYSSATFNGRPSAWLNSTKAGEQFGYSIAAGGDINGDGFADLLVGAPYCAAGTAQEAGCVYVFYGGNPPSNTPTKTVSPAPAYAHFGWSVSGNASVDGDAMVDMVVGAPNYTSGGLASRGAAYVIRDVVRANPPISGPILGKAAGDNFGFSVAAIPDLNGDAISDVAIGAPFNSDNGMKAGEVSVLYGSSKFTTTIDLTYMGEAAGEWFGWSIATGDFHNDGFSDLLVGAPNSSINATSAGRAYAFFGSAAPGTSPDLVLVPDAGADFFGGAVTVGGDSGGNITGDPAPDFAVADPSFKVGSLLNAGRVYLYAGKMITTPRNPVVTGFICVFNSQCSGLGGFTVTLQSTTGFSASTTSAANGSFRIAAVPGTFWLNASKVNYIQNSTTFTLVINQVKTVNFYVMTVPLVEGTVTDNVSGLVVGGATVAMYNGTTFVNETSSAANGTYSMYLPLRFVPAYGKRTNLILKVWDPTHYTFSRSFYLMRNDTRTVDSGLNRFPVITGYIRDALTNAGLAGATITATQGPSVLGNALTNNRGFYALLAVNASASKPVSLNVTHQSYARKTVSVSVAVNGTTWQNISMQLDSTPPTSSLSALPVYTLSPVYTLTATASDDNGVARVQLWYRYGGTGAYTLYGNDTTAPYTFSFNSTAAKGDGKYEFYALAQDYAGNWQPVPTSNQSWTIVDTTAPVSNINALPAYETTATFTVTANANDRNGVQSVTLYYRRAGGTWTGYATDTATPFTWAFSTSSTGGDGRYDFYSIAADTPGNTETAPLASDTTTFVDTVPPSVSISSPANNTISNVSTITVSWTATDLGSGVQTVQVSMDGGVYATVTGTSYAFTGLTDGTHTLSVKATDRGGLVTVASIRVTVDTTAPILSITAPAQGSTVSGPNVTVQWSASDAGTGLTDVKISLDGGAFRDLATTTSTTLTGLVAGQHSVVVRAIDGAGNSKDATVAFTVQAPSTPLGGSDVLLIGSIVVVIIVVAVIAAVLVRRRQTKPPTETPPEKAAKKEEGEEKKG